MLGPVHEMGFPVCIAGVGSGLTAFDLITRAQPDYLALDPVISVGATDDPTLMDIVQLLLRFAARIEARLIAPEVADVRQMKALRARRGRAHERRGLRPGRHPPAQGGSGQAATPEDGGKARAGAGAQADSVAARCSGGSEAGCDRHAVAAGALRFVERGIGVLDQQRLVERARGCRSPRRRWP